MCDKMRCSLPKAPSWVFWGIGVPSSLPAAQAGDGFHQGYVASPL